MELRNELCHAEVHHRRGTNAEGDYEDDADESDCSSHWDFGELMRKKETLRAYG